MSLWLWCKQPCNEKGQEAVPRCRSMPPTTTCKGRMVVTVFIVLKSADEFTFHISCIEPKPNWFLKLHISPCHDTPWQEKVTDIFLKSRLSQLFSEDARAVRAASTVLCQIFFCSILAESGLIWCCWWVLSEQTWTFTESLLVCWHKLLQFLALQSFFEPSNFPVFVFPFERGNWWCLDCQSGSGFCMFFAFVKQGFIERRPKFENMSRFPWVHFKIDQQLMIHWNIWFFIFKLFSLTSSCFPCWKLMALLSDRPVAGNEKLFNGPLMIITPLKKSENSSQQQESNLFLTFHSLAFVQSVGHCVSLFSCVEFVCHCIFIQCWWRLCLTPPISFPMIQKIQLLGELSEP